MDAQKKEALFIRINKALDTVRPHLAIDGGNVEVLDITDDMIVQVKWLGACVGCTMSQMTLKSGLESTIKNMVPEVIGVEAIVEDTQL